ncbi:hypothetical protein MTQ01_00420 [Streptomyces sp. XM4193]|uniref:WXG100 family type VII secretion target n=1 Tax=Streptomyces sp. XM4193 TaxID=2929782 RepID=UPI001FFBB075|nr:hypothetical protein [Streptomyces sp. XM4193]MCK1794516.1 hypothetical protein [Streptomyces sp. XM4193]
MSGFADTSEPVHYLKPPKLEGDEFSRGLFVDGFNTVSDLVSPTYWINEGIKLVFDKNPLDAVLEWFAGDWEAFFECSQAWENLAKCVNAMASNIDSGNKSLDATWNGNAADSAFIYFEQLVGKLDELESSLAELCAAYQNLSTGMYSAAMFVRTLLLAMGDALVLLAIELAAGTALSWTGVGAVVGYGLAALEIARLIKLWGDLTKQLTTAQQLVNAASGIVQGVGGTLYSGMVKFPVPGQTYDHPGV